MDATIKLLILIRFFSYPKSLTLHYSMYPCRFISYITMQCGISWCCPVSLKPEGLILTLNDFMELFLIYTSILKNNTGLQIVQSRHSAHTTVTACICELDMRNKQTIKDFLKNENGACTWQRRTCKQVVEKNRCVLFRHTGNLPQGSLDYWADMSRIHT